MKAKQNSADLPIFLAEARKFSYETSLETPEVARLTDMILAKGAVGVAQNVIGNAVHRAVEDSKASRIPKTVMHSFPFAIAFTVRLDNRVRPV